MIRGIQYFSAEVKPKLMSSQGAALNISGFLTFHCIIRLAYYENPNFLYRYLAMGVL